jgi:hypothetical protein
MESEKVPALSFREWGGEAEVLPRKLSLLGFLVAAVWKFLALSRLNLENFASGFARTRCARPDLSTWNMAARPSFQCFLKGNVRFFPKTSRYELEAATTGFGNREFCGSFLPRATHNFSA